MALILLLKGVSWYDLKKFEGQGVLLTDILASGLAVYMNLAVFASVVREHWRNRENFTMALDSVRSIRTNLDEGAVRKMARWSQQRLQIP